jgi:uncharacterized protein (TIGR03067 family)
MKSFNPQPPLPAFLLLCLSATAFSVRAGEQPSPSIEARLKAAVADLTSDDGDKRLQAAVELLRLGKQAEPAVPQLIATLRNSPEDHPVVILALGQIGEPAVKPLLAFLRQGPEAKLYRPLAALGWIGPQAREAAPFVSELLKNKDPNLVALSAYALARISPPDRPAAIEALQQVVARQPLQGNSTLLLVWLRPEEPGPLVTELVRLLGTQSCMFGEIDRIMGAYGLAVLGPAAEPAIPALRKALEDPEPLVRVLAAYALAQAKSPEDRSRALRILCQIAGQKPGPDFFTRNVAPSPEKLKGVEMDAIEAVVDVLLTQEPGARFPTSSILSWIKQGLRQSDGKLAEWVKTSPLSTTLAGEMVLRLDPEAAKKAQLPLALKRTQMEAEPSLVRKELARWTGAWEGQSGGAEDCRLFIEGDTFTLVQGFRFLQRGVLRLNPSSTPKAFDQTVTEGPEKGKTIQGIYKLEGDRLTLCYAYSSEKKPAERPTEFAAHPASARVLQTWKRISSDARGGVFAKIMTREEQDQTGVSRLSDTEKAALEKWLGKMLLQANADAALRYRARPNNVYHYKLGTEAKILSEDLAIEKARQTFAREGYKPEQWQLTRADMPPSKAPDGKADKHFDRFNFRPTEGRVYFTDGKQTRTVQVRLEGDWVVCFMFYGL